MEFYFLILEIKVILRECIYFWKINKYQIRYFKKSSITIYFVLFVIVLYLLNKVDFHNLEIRLKVKFFYNIFL